MPFGRPRLAGVALIDEYVNSVAMDELNLFALAMWRTRRQRREKLPGLAAVHRRNELEDLVGALGICPADGDEFG